MAGFVMVGLPDTMAGRYGGGSMRQFLGRFEDGPNVRCSRAAAHGQWHARVTWRGATVPPGPTNVRSSCPLPYRQKGIDSMYVVFEDIADATETKVHKASCPRYLNRKANASTTRWHGPFDTFQEAVDAATAIAMRKRYGVRRDPVCCWRD
jgi:hypothetical protein